jgi:dihydrofolate reductase
LTAETPITVSAIAAVASNGVIGRNNAMPWHLPEDLKYFKRMTIGKPVIMGRKAYEALGKPLPGRLNIVITRKPGPLIDRETPLFHEMEAALATSGKTRTGLIVVSSVDEALQKAKDAAREGDLDEIFITGGAQIYEAAMPFTQRLYITRIERDYEGDIVFPPFNENEWKPVSSERHKGDPAFTFTVLERI